MKSIQVEKFSNYWVVTLSRGRSNAINKGMIAELLAVIDEADKASVGIILSGGDGRIFSSGVDVLELYELSIEEVKQFWYQYFDLISALVNFKHPFVCAINGSCPAGGCVVALAADQRIMTDEPQFKIGLNEVEVGIIVPEAVIDLYRFWAGPIAYEHIQTARMLEPQEALDYGVLQEVVPRSEVLSRAVAVMENLCAQPRQVFSTVKGNLRKTLDQKFDAPDQVLAETLEFWLTPEFQEHFKRFVERLTRKKG